MARPLIVPSILNCDFSRLGAELDAIRNADAVHVDIMDGHFVPNLSFGPDITATVNRLTDLPLDVHLMIEEPERWVDRYIEAGADTVIFHVEATDDPVALARHLRAQGVRAAISLKPATSLEDYLPILGEVDQVLVMSVEPGFGGQAFMAGQLEKVRTLRAESQRRDLEFTIEIDGGINLETIGSAAEAGVDAFVAGSAIYTVEDPADAIRRLRDTAARAQ